MWTIRQIDEEFSRVWGEPAEFENDLAALQQLTNDFHVVTYITTLENGALIYSCTNLLIPGRVYVIIQEK